MEIDGYEEEEILAEPDQFFWSKSLFNSNAWFIIGLSAIILYLWKKRILTEYYLWKQNRRLTESYAKDKKETGLNPCQEEIRMCIVNKLQQQYNAKAYMHKELARKKAEKKRDELHKKYESTRGRKLNERHNPFSGSKLFSNLGSV